MLPSQAILYRFLNVTRNTVVTSYFSHQLVEVRKDDCEYPPIVDMSTEGQKSYHRHLWYDSIKALPTVEEKLYEIAMQQRMKLKIFLLSSVAPTYLGVPFQSYITRTHIIKGLPEKLTFMNVDTELNDIRNVFCDVLLQYYLNMWEENRAKTLTDYLIEKEAGLKLVKTLVSQCFKKLAPKNDYILESTVQNKCRAESFWWHQGFESKKDKLYEKNLCFQFQDYFPFVIRMKKPLSPLLDMNDPLCSTADVPNYNFHPKVFGIPFKREFIISVPGYWPGDSCEFPFLLVITSDRLRTLLSKIEKYDLAKIEDGVGVMSSFGWLNSIAMYQGFTPFHDVTYPFVTQTILTNGQDWNFFVYQLNTTAFHSDVDNKDHRNICWSSGKMRLFDTVEDGQVKGVNDEVFKVILKFLLNAPEVKESLVLKPYLGADVRTEEDKEHSRNFFRKMYSRAPHRRAHIEEVPAWQRIYKFHKDAPPSPFIRME